MIDTLIKTHKTVFSFADMQALFPDQKSASLKQKLRRYKKQEKLFNPQKGVRTLPVYDQKELAGKLFPGGYISLERVLFDVGVSFQRYGSTVHCIRHKSADIFFNNENYIARSIKPALYNNPLYIQQCDGYRKAMPERALCDLVYLRPDARFDNPNYFHTKQSQIRLQKLLPLYPKSTRLAIQRLLDAA